MKTAQCNIALDNGTRCPNMTYHNWARCSEHRRFNLGLNLTRNQKAVLWYISNRYQWHIDSPTLTPKRYINTLHALVRKGMAVRDGEGVYHATDWGKSVIGHCRIV